VGVASALTWLRSRAVARVARRYITGPGGAAPDLSMLPDTALWPLRRNGLDTVPELRRRGSEEPVSRLPVPFGIRVWLVTGYEPVREVLASTDGFSNDFARLAGSTGMTERHDPGGLGFADPPTHTRLRRLLAPEFTMRRLARLQPRIEAIVADRLDDLAGSDGPVDLWHGFALPVPALTICELLGVPYEDRGHFQGLSTARFDLSAGAQTSLQAVAESLTYLGGLIARQRRNPGDGLLGSLIRAHGDELDDAELAGLADGVLTGGLETSASMLALGALVLMDRPELTDALRSGEPADPVVEELLRYLAVVQVAFPRFALRDMRLGDVTIREGDVVMCSLSAANRDAAFGADPHTVDAARPPRPHLAFGHGIHRCVGAELARMELRVAYPALARRFPKMRLATGEGAVPFRDASIVFGVDSLPVLLT
jgi:cytochrome P450